MGWATAVLVAAGVLALAAVPPFVSENVRYVVMAGFSSVCHQIPGRSPHLNGIQLAVCHRCFGIYAALTATALFFPMLRRWDRSAGSNAKYLILAALVAPGLDWAAGLTGIWTNTAGSRLATGAVFGGVAGYLATGAVVRLFSDGKADEHAGDTSDEGRPTQPQTAPASGRQ